MPSAKNDLPIVTFASIAEWEAFLAAEPPSSKGAWLKLAKKGSGLRCVSRQEAIDGALCHGWIDGQLDALDETHWLVRFTPRRARSKWSENNRIAAERLIAEGRMTPAGQREVDAAKADGRWQAAYAPQSRAEVPDDLRRVLDAAPRAKQMFEALDGRNR